MNIKSKLGNRIREFRQSRGLTQEELAEQLNISAKSLSQVELGNNFVSADTLDNICNSLEVTPKQLFSFEFEIEQTDKVKEIVSRLNKNKKLMNTIYKIVLALDE